MVSFYLEPLDFQLTHVLPSSFLKGRSGPFTNIQTTLPRKPVKIKKK